MTNTFITTAVIQLGWTASDTLVIAHRNLLRYARLPRLLVFSTIQPVMFILLFNYVFGGAIHAGSGPYIDFLLPGILVQTVLFGATQTGIGLSDDLSRGMIERFRSLPMARSAVLGGRILADTTRNLFVVLLMIGVGTTLGFRFHGGFLETLAIPAFAILFGIPFSWASALIGISVKDAETAQVASFIWIFPLAFISSIFVPVTTMPGWLQVYAQISPVTVTVNTLRALSSGGAVGAFLWQSLVWIVGLTAVFSTFAIIQYRRST